MYGRFFQATLLLSLLLSLAILIVLLGTAISDAWPVLSARAGDFLTSNVSRLDTRACPTRHRRIVDPDRVRRGRRAAAGHRRRDLPAGTAKDTRTNRLLTTNIRNLAGVPSIVYGILGLVLFVQTMRAVTGPDTFGRSFISGGLTLAVLVLPIVILITMEAIRR